MKCASRNLLLKKSTQKTRCFCSEFSWSYKTNAWRKTQNKKAPTWGYIPNFKSQVPILAGLLSWQVANLPCLHNDINGSSLHLQLFFLVCGNSRRRYPYPPPFRRRCWRTPPGFHAFFLSGVFRSNTHRQATKYTRHTYPLPPRNAVPEGHDRDEDTEGHTGGQQLNTSKRAGEWEYGLRDHFLTTRGSLDCRAVGWSVHTLLNATQGPFFVFLAFLLILIVESRLRPWSQVLCPIRPIHNNALPVVLAVLASRHDAQDSLLRSYLSTELTKCP